MADKFGIRLIPGAPQQTMLPATVGCEPGFAFVFMGAYAAKNSLHLLRETALCLKHTVKTSVACTIGTHEKQVVGARVNQCALRRDPRIEQTRSFKRSLVPGTIRGRDLCVELA